MLRGRASQFVPEVAVQRPEMRAKGIAWCAVVQEGLIFTFSSFSVILVFEVNKPCIDKQEKKNLKSCQRVKVVE